MTFVDPIREKANSVEALTASARRFFETYNTPERHANGEYERVYTFQRFISETTSGNSKSMLGESASEMMNTRRLRELYRKVVQSGDKLHDEAADA